LLAALTEPAPLSKLRHSDAIDMPSLPDRADVVIIGGGFAGAATAYQLAKLGITDVVLVEREATCGYHASGRNAALGRQLVGDDEVTELTMRGAAFLREPPPGFSSSPLLAATGSLILAKSEAVLAKLSRRASDRDLPSQRLAPPQLTARWPRLTGVDAAGGIHFPTDGVIDIHALLTGFLAGARSLGSRVVVKCEVVGFRAGTPVVVETSCGEIAARAVVIAAGAWGGSLGELAGSSDAALTPIQRHLFLSEKTDDASAAAPFVWNLGEGEFYARPETGSYLLSGCDEHPMAPGDAQVMTDAITALAAKLARVAPGFADLGIARSWACMRTFTASGRPTIDWDEALPWLFWVVGLGGHGATASAAIGERAANRIAARIGIRYA
jgi:D-arginine dehydrogenase